MTATVLTMRRPVQIACPSCGSVTDAPFDCGVAYIPAGARAARAVAESPGMSDRAIAAEIGVRHPTVSRARKATGTDVPVDRRRGLRARRNKPWWWRVPAPMAFQRYAIAAVGCWALTTAVVLQESVLDWVRYLTLTAIFAGMAALSWGGSILWSTGERALLRPFRHRRPSLAVPRPVSGDDRFVPAVPRAGVGGNRAARPDGGDPCQGSHLLCLGRNALSVMAIQTQTGLKVS